MKIIFIKNFKRINKGGRYILGKNVNIFEKNWQIIVMPNIASQLEIVLMQ